MWDLWRLIWWALVGLFRSRRALEAENLVLRQRVNVLRRIAPKRLLISSIDRLILVGLYRLFPDVRGALAIVKPDTVIRSLAMRQIRTLRPTVTSIALGLLGRLLAGIEIAALLPNVVQYICA